MVTRRDFVNSLLMGISAFAAAVFALACGQKPDTEAEASPEWPPKDE